MILIFTPYSLEPLHPRIESIKEVFDRFKINYKIYNFNRKYMPIKFFRYLVLDYFFIEAIFLSIGVISKYKKAGIVYIQDLKYLPIAIIAKFFKKKVIYETLDNNIELIWFHNCKKYTFLKKFTLLKKCFELFEKALVQTVVDKTIVNSKALKEYFNFPVEIIFYTSPFENKIYSGYNKKNQAFLYLGAFVLMKGADRILQIAKKFDIPLFIFGTYLKNEINIQSEIEKNDNIKFFNKLSSKELENRLKSLFKEYNFIGISMTQEVNLSNATQEINKDIDYLAMGIPIIANHRKPTAEKIMAGCGVFEEDIDGINRLLSDQKFYNDLSTNCLNYYKKNYEQSIFEKKLIGVIRETDKKG